MAAEKTKQETGDAADAKPFSDRHRNLLTLIVVGGLMLAEGAGLMVAVKFFGGGPASLPGAIGPPGDDDDSAGNAALSELEVTNLMAFNSQNGRVFVYQVTVFIDVETKYAEKVQDLIEARENTIDDRLSKIVRAADPKYMDEPGLETLERLFRNELDDILGQEGLIKRVLFPEFSKTRAD